MPACKLFAILTLFLSIGALAHVLVPTIGRFVVRCLGRKANLFLGLLFVLWVSMLIITIICGESRRGAFIGESNMCACLWTGRL